MPRGERNEPDIYFGRPGALVQLPWPKGDVESPFDRLTHDFVTGAGQHQVAQLLGGSRLYTLSWNALHVDNYRKIEQYYLGAMGVGPWCIIDPSRPNLLMPNQAAATAVWNTTRDWSVSAADHGKLESNLSTAHIYRTGSPRSLRWYFNVAATAFPVLTLTTPYRSWPGMPVKGGLSYAFSARVKPDGVVDTSITVAAKIRWLDSAGVLIGAEVSGGDIAVGAWTRLSCIAVAPANAAYAVPRLVCTGSSIITGSSLYVDEPLMEQDTVVNDWAPGTGVRPVEILSLTDSTPFATRARLKPVMTLRELAQ